MFRRLPTPGLIGLAFRVSSLGAREGLLGDERRKRIPIIRARGGLVNPYRSSMLEDNRTALSGDAEPRRATRTRCLTYGRPTRS